MPARPMQVEELPIAIAMMRELWPREIDYSFDDEHVFVWERASGELGGFVSLSLRPWAEGCNATPVPYIEGWWVAADLRGTGVGRALIEVAERWCRERGYRELGSDVDVANTASLQAHAALGFEPTLRLQYFRRVLEPDNHGKESPSAI